MVRGARPSPSRPWRRPARRALRPVRLWWAALTLAALSAPGAAEITAAQFAEPTTRYAHGVLGDAVEYGALRLETRDGRSLLIRLPESRVFEDLAPRLADLDGDASPEVVVVESDAARGARLSVYGEAGLIDATPFIGQPFRWLAPAGIADLDGDGATEIAYVDRPHLARVLRIWRYAGGRLTEIARADGLTNHRIGDDFISGGLRDCGDGPEILLATPDWSEIVAARLERGRIETRALGRPASERGFAAARACTP
ncbi:hypothetical protein Ga0609869_000334 [Rhodovulum iodosum]|uniref:VCBS repeat-containing protein n=1 Tax=Rhodovulum iodosum TaxID=68291 RepID=A0ABV3XNU7_9RHOB|nr:VCBS repeat-containing protein [Rhodovulum robiginosum]RSK37924.1 VCBS repeat-containing protein [Rhodovulum robiginosum]